MVMQTTDQNDLKDFVYDLEVSAESLPINCQGYDCPHDIREGNETRLLLKQVNDEWKLEKMLCIRCDISDTLQRYSNDKKICGIIATVEYADVEKPTIGFTDIKVIDVLFNNF